MLKFLFWPEEIGKHGKYLNNAPPDFWKQPDEKKYKHDEKSYKDQGIMECGPQPDYD